MRYALLLCYSLGFVQADEIAFETVGRVTGTVESVNEANEISLRSALSPDPLIIDGKRLSSILFDKNDKKTPPAPNLIYLKNGEIIPADLNSLDADRLDFKTQWSNSLQVARKEIDSLHFGTTENQLLYRGPNDKEWQLGNTWKFDKALVSAGYGSVSRKFDSFPERYIIQFHCEWTGNAGLQCFFGGSTANVNENTDCYMLTFNNAGLELKRRSTQGNKYTSLAGFTDFTPNDIPDNSIEVEIRVDNNSRLLQLRVNDKALRNNIVDPTETGAMPTGSYLHFISTTAAKDMHTITNIRLSTWGSAGGEAQQESRTDNKKDILFDFESNRSTGVLKSISPGKDPMILFENPHDPNPQPLPASKVAVIYFSGEAGEQKPSDYVLQFLGAGRLNINQFTVNNGILSTKHPLLGDIQIPTAMILEISRSDSQN